MRPARLLGLVLVGVGACTEQVSNPNNQAPQQNGEQAETDLAVARDRITGQPVLVSSYRWTGPAPIDLGPNDIDYGSGPANNLSQAVTFHRGASLGGFAFSADGGRSWNAPGKVRPPAQQFPILWGDARLAVDRLHPYRVAMTNLAVSDQAYRSAQGYDASTDSLHRWPTGLSEFTQPPQCNVIPGQQECDIVDSVCVSLSSNAGRTFQTPACHQERRCSQNGASCLSDAECSATGETCTPRSLDQPTVAFDENGLAVAAFWENDERAGTTAHDKLLLYRLTPAGQFIVWVPLAIDDVMTSHYFPKVRADRLGRIWLAAPTNRGTTAGIQLCRLDPGSDTCTFVQEVTFGIDTVNAQPNLRVPNVPNVPLFTVRTGQALDFAVNVVGANNATEMRFVYHSGTSPLAIHVLQCTLDDANPVPTCSEHPEWSTDGLGQDAAQPTISMVDRSPAGDGTNVTWDYAFITGPNANVPSPNPPYAVAFNRAMVPNGGAVRLNDELPPDICVAHYPVAFYWGDFIGFAGFRDPRTGQFAHIATWSSDNLRGCNPTNLWQGSNLHIAASSWTDLTQ